MKYTYNSDFFHSINDEKTAYWLGFIAADGCVFEKEDGYRLKIGLQEKDMSHLEKFCADLESNLSVKTQAVKVNGKAYGTSSVQVNSTKLCRDLISHGIHPQKTFTLKMPSIPNNLMRHYIRGFIDGDGCYYINKRAGKDTYRYAIEIVGGSYQFLEGLKNHLQDNDISSNIYRKRDKNWKLVITRREDIVKTIDYLYLDSSIYLDRKQIKALDMKEKLAV